MNNKGQISFEFFGAVTFYIIVLATVLFFAVDQMPDIERNVESASLNYEARHLTDQILSSPGYHSGGNTNWEENIDQTTSVGLAKDYHRLDMEKLEALDMVDQNKLNYQEFREINDLDNQYLLEFTAVPVVTAYNTYIRTEPPRDPDIVEPDTSNYHSSGNTVRYGSFEIRGNQYNIILTSTDGVYDEVYLNEHSEDGWDFEGVDPVGERDNIQLGGQTFRVEGIQNTGDRRGTVVIMSRPLKQFGSQFDTSSSVTNLNRYASIQPEDSDPMLVRVEVYAWD